jgi:hypothetical protein
VRFVSMMGRHRFSRIGHGTDVGIDLVGGVEADENFDMPPDATAESLDPPLTLFSR